MTSSPQDEQDLWAMGSLLEIVVVSDIALHADYRMYAEQEETAASIAARTASEPQERQRASRSRRHCSRSSPDQSSQAAWRSQRACSIARQASAPWPSPEQPAKTTTRTSRCAVRSKKRMISSCCGPGACPYQRISYRRAGAPVARQVFFWTAALGPPHSCALRRK